MTRFAVAALILGLSATPAGAALVFDNPIDSENGSCAFTTQCSGTWLVAQKFTLATATTLTSASFTAYDDLANPLGVNWWVYALDNKSLPGEQLASGTNEAMTSRKQIGTQGDWTVVKESFALPSIKLGAGTYYLGFQAVTDSWEVYLANATLHAGSAQSYDNGGKWRKNYNGKNGVAVSLSGTVPEPATWALLIAGFGMSGIALRRQRTASAAA